LVLSDGAWPFVDAHESRFIYKLSLSIYKKYLLENIITIKKINYGKEIITIEKTNKWEKTANLVADYTGYL